MISLHSLKNAKGARHRKMRVGRGEGSGKGKTSGRGNKGQMSRSGSGHKPAFEGGQMRLIRRLPKRGFNHPREISLAPVNISEFAMFNDGDVVSFETMRKAGLANGTVNGVKVLGTGEIGKKLTIKAQAFSASAKSKIEAAGGQCEIVKPIHQ